MENKFILIVMVMFCISFVSAGALDLTPAQQFDKNDKTTILDTNYVVKEDGAYFKDLKQDTPIVYIDKKVGNVYHVDSYKDFDKVANESVMLEFFYDIQPDWIAHYTHSGKFDRYYFPTQWTWTANCTGEEECSGGWVQIEVQNIERGFGSSTFPIGTTGPTWAYEGEFYGDFDTYAYIRNQQSLVTNFTKYSNFTFSIWADLNNNTQRISWPGLIAIDRYDDANFGVLFLLFKSHGGLSMEYSNGSSKFSTTCQGSCNDFSDGDGFNHYIVTVQSNGTNFNTTFYIDSSFKQSESDYLGSNDIGGSGRVTIGAYTDGSAINGSLDEVLIYNRTLDATEIADLYNNYTLTSAGPRLTGAIPNETGLVLNINFDDYSVADLSGSENHGTNTNVSFGEIFDDRFTLVEDTHYTLEAINSKFTIIDKSLDRALINYSQTLQIGQQEVSILDDDFAFKESFNFIDNSGYIIITMMILATLLLLMRSYIGVGTAISIIASILLGSIILKYALDVMY